MTLGLPKGPLEVVEPKNKSNMIIEFASLLNRWKQQLPEHDSIPKCGEIIKMIIYKSLWEPKRRSQLPHFKRTSRFEQSDMTKLGAIHDDSACAISYQEDSLDKAIVIDEEDEVNEEERCNKNIEDGKAATYLIITNSQLPTEVITELEELTPGARNPLKRARKGHSYEVKEQNPVLMQGSYESEEFLMEIDATEKRFVGSQDTMHDFPQFTPSSFSPGCPRRRNKHCSKELFLLIRSLIF
ncbi:hypothetical protein Cgig2_017169 [Carnegiea gigantea]|uniref:Uncharacterized protein n=1 Tax=Carnegiea gigantea TaxID=171969 RepID=A0A9Q1QEW8_9CARY|nr:hypothetical protein Cgig2_017169 [Carnegiea gigantea]